jgi:WD40 repeat protein
MQLPGPVRALAFSPDGRTILAGGADGTTRLWQSATGKAIGPALKLGSRILAVTITPDGRTMRLSDENQLTNWAVPVPVAGEADQLILWVQVMTGLELGADGVVRPLDVPTWRQRRQRLNELGGPPLSWS